MVGREKWSQLGSAIAGVMFICAMFNQFIPYRLRRNFKNYTQKTVSFFYPYIQITFHEYSGELRFQRSQAYADIETYLGANTSTRAKCLKADMVKDSKSLVLSMDDNEEVTDEFQGIKLWWASNKQMPKTQTISWRGRHEGRRYFKLNFHRRHRDIVMNSYLKHVLEEAKVIALRTRQRKLYTNNPSKQWVGYRKTIWSHVMFEHPANFETLGMEPKKKQEIINELKRFKNSKAYYAKVGKAWKRGYLLHGPPGTGKSTLIAAMANLLEYDVYDLELTTVKNNTKLRRLLINTSNKSIIVMEDIDCSLDLTGQREKEKEKEKENNKTKEEEKEPSKEKMKNKEEDKGSEVTLSGLLNFIDGLWSACGEERIIVFTTNYVEKLDPALIRRGRMDKHIELSYCCFDAFKVLAMNYLDLDSHPLFATISCLLKETNMTPADVAENLMPKSSEEDALICLEKLIKAIEKAKEEARLKAEEEEEEKRVKAEEEKKDKEIKVQNSTGVKDLET